VACAHKSTSTLQALALDSKKKVDGMGSRDNRRGFCAKQSLKAPRQWASH